MATVDEELEHELNHIRQATHEMLQRFEWVIPLFQAPVFIVSISVDPIKHPAGVVFNLAMMALHVALIPIYYRKGGPLSWGGWWFYVAYLQPAALLIASSHVMQANSYGTSAFGVPLFVYGVPILGCIAIQMLPRNVPHLEGRRLALLGAYYPFMVLMIWWVTGGITVQNLLTAAYSFMWYAIAYVMGKAFAFTCRRVAARLVSLQREQDKKFFESLHSDVLASIATIEAQLPGAEAGDITQAALQRVKEIVQRTRTDLTLNQSDVNLAELVSARMKEYRSVGVKVNARLGGLTVRRSTGRLLRNSLGDLVTNALEAGAADVEVTILRTGGVLSVEVSDDGPGFSEDLLDSEATTLNRLRSNARASGGDLTKHSRSSGNGVIMRLTLPLAPGETREGDSSIAHRRGSRAARGRREERAASNLGI